MSTLLETLETTPLLADGGMGTQLILRGMTPSDNALLWNVDRPEDIRAVHTDYLNAGCRILTSNTFQGSATALKMHGLSDRMSELNRAGASLAKQVADQSVVPVYVFADLGPFGGFLEPLGDTEPEELEAIFTGQWTALRAGGADVALVETMSDPSEVAIAVKTARAVSNWPVVCTYAFQNAGGMFRTMMGTTVQEVVDQTLEAGADVVGANCGTDLSLDNYRALADELLKAVDGRVPVILQPNAGAPRQENGEAVYDATPEDMAVLVRDLAQAGIRIIGGCCGTTPAHLTAMADALQEN